MAKRKGKTPKPENRTGSKQAQVIELLQSKVGATIDALVKATEWQPHSVRAAISGLRKAGYTIETKQIEGQKAIYRIVATRRAA